MGEELLIYDQDRHIAHCLSPIAACVWRHCDGERDVSELAVLAGASESLAADALRELREKDLLDAEPELMQGTGPGESRREAIVRVTRYGAAVAAGSMIVSATAATPAMASSGEEFTKKEEEVEGLYKCKPKTGALNCCDCKDAIGYGSGNQASCENICNTTYGGYLSWTKEAIKEI
ncbi:MAG TPA: hypothetical protein VK790_07445 [Solirubrobacteraceae bacterium]|nr:hypothetical protein [Solirubrobacteraceae bacterium]